MKIPKNSLVLTAAFAGLASGVAARATQPLPAGSDPAPVSGSFAGTQFADKKQIEKHACKGLNSCKGNGGGTKKEWGKNS